MSATKVKDCLHEKAIECREHGYLLSAKKIGMGAFSKVYLGYATPNKIRQNDKLASDLRSKNHNMVAIKIISINEEYSKTFLHREIRALNATYRHPSVIQLYDMFQSSKCVYLVLELAMQGDLLDHISAASLAKGSPGLPEDEARRIFRQIVTAVAHCHNNHVVHRDLKCENILLDERGLVKLTDFGFANHYTDRNVLMSTFCGSVAYTAPEILLSCKYNGEQADLWSMGVILYAMVTGKLPYHEKHPCKLVQLIRKGLPFYNPVSEACQDLIMQLLQWRPSDRLPLCQIVTHHWMLFTISRPLCEIHIKNDIPDKTQHKKAGTSTLQVSPLNHSHIHLPEGPEGLSVCGHRPSGSYTAGSQRNFPTERRSGSACPITACPSPRHLLIRTTQTRQNWATTSSLTAPSTPKPFHNLPNYRKPGSAPSTDVATQFCPLHNHSGRAHPRHVTSHRNTGVWILHR